jgi:hypothetical protein
VWGGFKGMGWRRIDLGGKSGVWMRGLADGDL